MALWLVIRIAVNLHRTVNANCFFPPQRPPVTRADSGGEGTLTLSKSKGSFAAFKPRPNPPNTELRRLNPCSAIFDEIFVFMLLFFF